MMDLFDIPTIKKNYSRLSLKDQSLFLNAVKALADLRANLCEGDRQGLSLEHFSSESLEPEKFQSLVNEFLPGKEYVFQETEKQKYFREEGLRAEDAKKPITLKVVSSEYKHFEIVKILRTNFGLSLSEAIAIARQKEFILSPAEYLFLNRERALKVKKEFELLGLQVETEGQVEKIMIEIQGIKIDNLEKLKLQDNSGCNVLMKALTIKENLTENEWKCMIKNSDLSQVNIWGANSLIVAIANKANLSDTLWQYLIKNSNLNQKTIGINGLTALQTALYRPFHFSESNWLKIISGTAENYRHLSFISALMNGRELPESSWDILSYNLKEVLSLKLDDILESRVPYRIKRIILKEYDQSKISKFLSSEAKDSNMKDHLSSLITF